MKLWAIVGFVLGGGMVVIASALASSTSGSWGSPTSPASAMTPTPTPAPIEPSLTKEQKCGAKSGGPCSECVDVKKANCYYCTTSKECFHYQTRTLFPKGDCEWSKIQWYTCSVNFQAMIISMALMGGILVLSLIICICCCCRKRNKPSAKYAHEEAKREREREERRVRGQLKQKERQSKYDEIRKKYGLNKDDPPYHKFDA